MAKRGRPITDEARKYVFTVRLTREETEMLYYLMDRKGMTISEIFRKGVLMQYNLAKFT